MIAGAAGREAWGDREPALRGGEFRGRQSVDGTRRRPTAHPDTAKVENCATCPSPSLVGGGEGRGGALGGGLAPRDRRGCYLSRLR